MAVQLKDADRLIYECSANGTSLFVVKQNRLNKTIKFLKKAIDLGRFGRIYQANVNVFWSRTQEYYDLANWRGTKEMDGGAFTNQAGHYVDMIYYLFGNAKSVLATTKNFARKIEVEDSGAAIIELKNDILCTLN
ncbi:MAG: Gfo/Idh/MocA family oxidoreductase, partial [Oligoflexia bacterium]|nr:Gfo/Idh/MocA family oxidoreductase [Oligoflexia bacterium]